MNNIFQGLITALVTPFKNGQLDFESLAKLIEYQIQHQIDGLVIAGTTGEGLLLEYNEYLSLLEKAIFVADNRIKIIASCSNISTRQGVKMTIAAQDLKADGLMVSIPSYLKPTQEGIYQHFKEISQSANLPIMLYSNPGRTNVDFAEETVVKLALIENIVAFKDSSANLDRALNLKLLINDANFNFLSGDDSITLAFYAHGAKGWVSVAANVVPHLCKEVHNLWMEGKPQAALQAQLKLMPLYSAFSCESNPITIKFAMHHLNFCSNEIRSPLTEATENSKIKIINILQLLKNIAYE